jgi:hypothetical protein
MNLDLPQIGGECQDFTRWWNSEGQFLQPIGDMQSEYGLDFAKKIAEAVYDSTHKLILEAQEETEEAQKALKDKISVTDTLTEANLLIDHIEDIVEITLSSKDKTIKDLIETYRENNED